MIDVSNRVLTNVKYTLGSKCSNYVASENDTPSKFPAMLINQYDNRDAAMDLENSENGVTSDIRIQSYSNKSLTEAKSLIADACDAMRTMGYRRTFGPKEIENVADRNVKRCEARFRRFVGDLYDIPRFQQEQTQTQPIEPLESP